MPAWISNSMKVLSSIVMCVVTTVFLLFAGLYTLFTGMTLIKGWIVIGLFFIWLMSFICVAQKLYRYLFGIWKDRDE